MAPSRHPLSAQAELVEALPFLPKEGQCFDKLSMNGLD